MTTKSIGFYVTRALVKTLLLSLFGFAVGFGYTEYRSRNLPPVQEVVSDTCTPHLFDDHCGCLEDSLIYEVTE